MRVLVAAADAQTLIFRLGEIGGLHVETADCLQDVLDLIAVFDFELIVLDLGAATVRSVRALRDAEVTAPVLALLADTSATATALNAGADDAPSRDLSTTELIARVGALVRRSKGVPSPVLTFGSLAIDLGMRSARVAGHPVHLTGREWVCLEALALAKGRQVTKERFYSAIYGGDCDVELKIVDVFICKLRAKLRGPTGEQFIETIWGQGYALREPAEAAA